MSGIVGTPGSNSGIIGNGGTIGYSTGTWTGDLRFGGASGTVNGQGTGTYTKIGRKVTIHYSVSINNNTSGSGQVYITGLPFTCGSYDSQATLYTNDYINTTSVVPVIINGQNYIVFYILPQGTTSTLGSFTNSLIHSSYGGKLMRLTATYTATS